MANQTWNIGLDHNPVGSDSASHLLDSGKTALPPHPYHPRWIVIPSYAPNTLAVPQLLILFACGTITVLALSTYLCRRSNPNLSSSELRRIGWFALCGSIHLFFEGYFVCNFDIMGHRLDLFGQLWKEYSKSDSRYLTKNSFVFCMEAVTAILWGPLSFWICYLITFRQPQAYLVQALVSMGQLYGVILYCATCFFGQVVDQVSYSRPEGYYYYGYYLGMNLPWFLIPSFLIFQSCRASFKAPENNAMTQHQAGPDSVPKKLDTEKTPLFHSQSQGPMKVGLKDE